MSKLEQRLLGYLLLATLAALSAGCVLVVAGAAAGAGVAGYAYVEGELKATEGASLDRTWQATLDSIKALQLPVLSQAKDPLTARLVLRNAANKNVTISLKQVGPTATEVSVRVGTFGDEAYSRMILEQIQKHL